jgi:hypothetical protein
MCSVFQETPSFHHQQAMTIVNVNRSLTICSIINSFLKVIVWMRLVATPGSFFVGDPSGGPPRDLLLVANKKNHPVPDKNKTMILATQVAKPSLVLSLPSATTVSNSTRTITHHHQKKKKIIGSFVENKFNLEDRLEELVLRYRNVTSSHDVLVNWEEDSVLLVRPSFSFFPSSTEKNMIPDSDEEQVIEFFLKNTRTTTRTATLYRLLKSWIKLQLNCSLVRRGSPNGMTIFSEICFG